ncbi:MAG: phage recombination protein Bet [Spirochaetes bacterium]|jgi:phage recombination protein Bet|nr:phage recombination protein Bet [Spirochaetota bacterium]
MEKSLQTVNSKTELQTEITTEKLIEYLDVVGLSSELKPQEKTQFIEIARAYQLNPFKREVYCVAYGQGQYRKLSIITGYEVYLKRAERTGLLNGWKIRTEGQIRDSSLKAIIEVYRKDWTQPFVHEVYYREYVQKDKNGKVNRFWSEKPVTMLKKVVIAQAFRLCFPDEIGGMPYTSDELPENMTTGNTDTGKTDTGKTGTGKTDTGKTENKKPESKTKPKTEYIPPEKQTERPKEITKTEYETAKRTIGKLNTVKALNDYYRDTIFPRFTGNMHDELVELCSIRKDELKMLSDYESQEAV